MIFQCMRAQVSLNQRVQIQVLVLRLLHTGRVELYQCHESEASARSGMPGARQIMKPQCVPTHVLEEFPPQAGIYPSARTQTLVPVTICVVLMHGFHSAVACAFHKVKAARTRMTTVAGEEVKTGRILGSASQSCVGGTAGNIGQNTAR
jgi:hypothetical protein